MSAIDVCNCLAPHCWLDRSLGVLTGLLEKTRIQYVIIYQLKKAAPIFQDGGLWISPGPEYGPR